MVYDLICTERCGHQQKSHQPCRILHDTIRANDVIVEFKDRMGGHSAGGGIDGHCYYVSAEDIITKEQHEKNLKEAPVVGKEIKLKDVNAAIQAALEFQLASAC